MQKFISFTYKFRFLTDEPIGYNFYNLFSCRLYRLVLLIDQLKNRSTITFKFLKNVVAASYCCYTIYLIVLMLVALKDCALGSTFLIYCLQT